MMEVLLQLAGAFVGGLLIGFAIGGQYILHQWHESTQRECERIEK